MGRYFNKKIFKLNCTIGVIQDGQPLWLRPVGLPIKRGNKSKILPL